MYNENKENRINYKESSLLEEFDIYDSLHAVQPVSTIMMNGIRYYTKIHTSDTPVNIWNDLYGKNTGRFLHFEDALYDYENNLSYFPELGTPISKEDPHFSITCKYACDVVQIDLNGIGYSHADLYNSDEYGDTTYLNCNNVREYMGDYFAINTEKIFKLPNGGNKKRKRSKKSKKAKKTHNKKAKKAKKSHNKKSKKVKKSKK